MPTQLDITPTPAPTLLNLTITSTIKGVQLAWDIPSDPTHDSTEIWHNTENDFGTATKLAEVWGNTYVHVDAPIGVLRYYWIRSRNIYGRADGALTAGYATPGAVQTEDVALNAITAISTFSSFAPLSIANYDVYEIAAVGTMEGNGSNVIVDIQNLINLSVNAFGSTGSAAALSRISIVKSTYVKGGTVSVENGSNVVIGEGTDWLSSLSPGDIFFVSAGSRYVINTVDSDTQITLTHNYAGETANDLSYIVLTDSAIIFQMSQTVGRLSLAGSHLYSHFYPFFYRRPMNVEEGYFYDFYVEWGKTRDDSSWDIGVSSLERTIVVTELKR